jgi:hypothetical protein
MAVNHLQSVVNHVLATVAGRVVKTTAYRQPWANLSLPSRFGAGMPNRMPGHERLDREAALAARAGRSAGCPSGLPQRSRPHVHRGITAMARTAWGKRCSTSFSPRIELSRPCAWGRPFEA